MGKRLLMKGLALIVLTSLCTIFFQCNLAEAANGRVIIVDGINPISTATGSISGESGTGYLYAAIDSDWQIAFRDKIGPIQPFYWANDANYNDAAIQSLTDILMSAYAQTKSANAPLVVISHSWGTFLAYVALSKNPDIVVDKLITMGSPLDADPLSSNPVRKIIGSFTALKLLLQLTTVHPLSNVKIWNNYWASCDWVSASIDTTGTNNIQCDSSFHEDGLCPLIVDCDPITCHGGYYEDHIEWEQILSDALNTEWPLEISYDPPLLSAPANVNFNAIGSLTANAISYTWDFGDDQKGSGKSVSHFYKQPRNYNVTLTMTDGAGPHVQTESVIVRPPEIKVSYPDGFESLHRHFSTQSNSHVNDDSDYSWNYGDGTPIETGRTQGHTYPDSGDYYVTLTLTLDDASTVSNTQPIFVGPGTRYIQGHTVFYDETWYTGGTYVVQGGITVAQGATLVIEPGTRVKLSSGVQIDVFGTLTATNVLFTWADGTNQWSGLHFAGAGSSGSKLENCTVEHALGVGFGCNYWGFQAGAIVIEHASPTITGCTIKDGAAQNGIWMKDASPIISNNAISGFTSGGVRSDSYSCYTSTSSPTVTGNNISGNGTGIAVDSLDSGTYQGNSIKANFSYGIYYSGISIIDATNNNWGDPTGPLDDSDDRATGGWYNPNGFGNKVSDYVKYSPWTGGSIPVPGDINHDGKVDLADTVLALQIMAGIVPTPPVFLDADVNNDSRIGMEEMIYIFDKMLGKR
ncbi:MAG: PKD domain-containing protein [Desulfosalsimonadaceae bacterium]